MGVGGWGPGNPSGVRIWKSYVLLDDPLLWWENAKINKSDMSWCQFQYITLGNSWVAKLKKVCLLTDTKQRPGQRLKNLHLILYKIYCDFPNPKIFAPIIGRSTTSECHYVMLVVLIEYFYLGSKLTTYNYGIHLWRKYLHLVGMSIIHDFWIFVLEDLLLASFDM